VSTSQAIWGAPCRSCGANTVRGVVGREGLVEACCACGVRHRVTATAAPAPPVLPRPNDATVRPRPRESHRLKRRLEKWAREHQRR